MDNLDPLVKLASFGTAGVAVLAIFIVGTIIMKLTKDTPSWKVNLMKRYVNFCLIIAIICSISGIANAYFNQGKIEEAKEEGNNKVDKIEGRYQKEKEGFENYKTDLEKNLESILQNEKNLTPETQKNLKSFEKQINQFELKPFEVIKKDIEKTDVNPEGTDRKPEKTNNNKEEMKRAPGETDKKP